MKKILLCCSSGMSTSLLVNKMRKVAVIDTKDYGTMDGKKVLSQAVKLIKS